MNTENEINEEVRQLLDSLEEHGKNARRQQELSNLIDGLSEKELGTGTSLRGTKQSKKQVEPLDCFVVPPRKSKIRRSQCAKRRKLHPLWWVMGAAAACLLLWLLVKPTKQHPEMNDEILVEETETIDSVKTKMDDVVPEEPIAFEELLAEEAPVVPQKPQMTKENPRAEITEETVEQTALAEVIPTETHDTTNIGSNTIPTTNETPSAVQSHRRRVIRSLNLVCYDCQKEPEFYTKPVLDDKTLFGQPQDPNMKNGSLALEIKLN